MVDNPAIPVWTIGAWQPGIGDSSIGFQHQSEGLPNQDAYCLEQYDSISATLCVIADGHSGESALRSQVGSRLAVESFRRVVEKDVIPIFRSGNVDAGQLEELWTKVEKRVEKLWIEECLKHLLENPFSENENKIRLGQIELVKRPVSAYSTTLSGALLTQDFGLFLHLGDAELILANTDGVTESVSRSSVVPEESLGSANRLPFISRVLTGQDWHSKQLVFLATDGVGDAFSNKEAVHEHVVDYLNKWRDKGSPKKLSILTRDHCLRFSGEGGSGGDATLLIVKRFEKEDILSRGEFESAWIEFERNKINLLAEVHHSADQLKQKLKLFSDKMIQDSNSAKTDLDQTGKRNRDEIIRIGDEHFNKITKRAGDVLTYFDEQGSKLDKNEKEIENLSRRVRLLSVVLIVIVLFLVLSSLLSGVLTGAPETGAPETGAPETGAPETGAPETGAKNSATSKIKELEKLASSPKPGTEKNRNEGSAGIPIINRTKGVFEHNGRRVSLKDKMPEDHPWAEKDTLKDIRNLDAVNTDASQPNFAFIINNSGWGGKLYTINISDNTFNISDKDNKTSLYPVSKTVLVMEFKGKGVGLQVVDKEGKKVKSWRDTHSP